MNNLKETIEDILKQFEENETGYGEPQAWLALDNGRSLEIVEEREGLEEKDYFYSCRVHCSEQEFDNGEFRGTCGILDTFNTGSLEKRQLEDIVKIGFKSGYTK